MYLASCSDHPIDRDELSNLVPLNELTMDHLESLLRDKKIDVVCAGQRLFEIDERDASQCYLLSGEIALVDSDGSEENFSASDLRSRFPLVPYQPRRHTAVAKTDCTVIRFESDKLDAMLAWDQAASYIVQEIAGQRELDEDADWMLTLLRSNLFYKVPPMNIRAVLHNFKPQFYGAGETIIRQGEIGDCCYFIKEGSVSVYRANDESQTQEHIADLGAGFCFGEDALVNQDKRNATVKMSENGVLMVLSKTDFCLLLKPAEVTCIDLDQLTDRLKDGATAIDVRSQDEYEWGHYESAANFPFSLLKLKARLLEKEQSYIFYCDSGRRSMAAAYLLSQEGYDVCYLNEGINGLALEQQRLFEAVQGNETLLKRTIAQQ